MTHNSDFKIATDLVSTVNVANGEKVEEGQLLMTLEAMKMQTAVFARRSATLTDLLVAPGQAADAKELMAIVK